MRPGVCLKVKSVGKPDAVAPHVRFDERGWETGLHATAPVLDSTARNETFSQILLNGAKRFRMVFFKVKRGITQKIVKVELWFLCTALPPMLFCVCVKLHASSCNTI